MKAKIILVLIAAAVGFGAGLIAWDLRAPVSIQPVPQTSTAVKQPTYPRTDIHTYTDLLLGFAFSVPDTWVNRYAAVENGQSVSFAFETADSQGGTHNLGFSNVFTIYRLAPAAYSAKTCPGCTEIKRTKTDVYAYAFDGQPKALFPNLTPANIRTDLLQTVAPSFHVLDQ